MRITRRRLTCSSSSPDRARLPRAGSSRSSDAIARRRGTLHAIVSLAVLAWAAAPASASAQEPADTTDGAALVEGLLWQRGTNGASVPWDAAHEYCETLEHAGFDDWRLPTLAELETLHDPSRDSGIRAPLELDDCCVWSATNLVDVPPEAKGQLPPPTNAPADYYWGYLFASGVRYYSFRRFPDGLAMCVRDAS